jgi:hypothetical protein
MPQPHTLSIAQVFPIAIATIALFPLLRIGMGDLKLWLGMLISQGQILLSLEYLHFFLVATISVLIITWLRFGDRRASVAFGPSLVMPFLLIYLGI